MGSIVVVLYIINFCAEFGVDVTVSSNTLRPTASTPLVPVFFTLLVDGVSQEILETFNITLTLNPGTIPEFFNPNISVSIMDRDSEFSHFLIHC